MSINPLNIYNVSRIHDENAFNAVTKHLSNNDRMNNLQFHEIESLRYLTDKLLVSGVEIEEMDGFFYSYTIAQIGKEFDLLKIREKECLNIELKSTMVPENQILKQLMSNQHYLSHLGKRLMIYSIITDTMNCYKLSLNGELVETDFEEIIAVIKRVSKKYKNEIDSLFKPSYFLVSPLNTPERFIQGEYFLTQAQETIKKDLLQKVDDIPFWSFFHITGRPGTGKTLLIYDIAKTLSRNGKTLIIHCGKLSSGQKKLNKEINNLDVISAVELKKGFDTEMYNYILVDETHRIYEDQFEKLIESVKKSFQICIFSSDPEQILSSNEKRRDIVGRIELLELEGEYRLSERIRTNKEIYSFIENMMNLHHQPKQQMNYSDIELNYANTTQEAQNMISYYRNKGYVFINYSKSNFDKSPYDAYWEDFDTHHVIGQEFDNVIMLMDKSFYYDENGVLQGIPHPTPDYLYPNLFYHGATRVREHLALIVVDAPELFSKILMIVNPINDEQT